MPQPPRTVAELADRVRQGVRVKYVFFLGREPRPDGSPGRGCLSQWWPAPIEADGLTFSTAEHYMMWHKAELFGDHKRASQILATTHPNEVKRLGRQVAGFDQRVWANKRYGVVLAGQLAKFRQHADLRAFLMATGDRVLAEASPHDAIWGIGLAEDDPRVRDPANWPGLNLLGFALMEARSTLRAEGLGSSARGLI